MNKAIKYIGWFLVGQAVQIILAVLAKVSFMSKPILFSVAAGILITVAILAGVRLAGGEPKHEKSYMDYAEGRDTE